MNKISFIILFTAAAYAAAAQEAPQKETRPRTAPQKGYYAIGNNADKSPAPVMLYATRTVKEPLRKGYYAIEAKSRPAVVIDLPSSRTKATKGYYAIDGGRSDSSKTE